MRKGLIGPLSLTRRDLILSVVVDEKHKTVKIFPRFPSHCSTSRKMCSMQMPPLAPCWIKKLDLKTKRDMSLQNVIRREMLVKADAPENFHDLESEIMTEDSSPKGFQFAK